MIQNHDASASRILSVLVNFLRVMSLLTLAEYVNSTDFKKEIEYLLVAQGNETLFLMR